jgi:uncharacterized protein (DUF302 family)
MIKYHAHFIDQSIDEAAITMTDSLRKQGFTTFTGIDLTSLFQGNEHNGYKRYAVLGANTMSAPAISKNIEAIDRLHQHHQ